MSVHKCYKWITEEVLDIPYDENDVLHDWNEVLYNEGYRPGPSIGSVESFSMSVWRKKGENIWLLDVFVDDSQLVTLWGEGDYDLTNCVSEMMSVGTQYLDFMEKS